MGNHASLQSPLAELVHASRLIGADSMLALHGGGNTSLKLNGVLHVKGTGQDLAHVTAASFSALDLTNTRAVLQANPQDNAVMRQHLTACVVRPSSPRPSIETLMHAGLPHACVMHTHSYATLAALNVAQIEAKHAEVFGDLAPLVPYRHSGHALARACVDVYEQQATRRTIGLALAYHGVVSLGETVQAARDNMLALAARAQAWLTESGAWDLPLDGEKNAIVPAPLIETICSAAGKRLVCHVVCNALTRQYAARSDLAEVSRQGPATPQHAVYTRRVPLIDGDVRAYTHRYRAYLEQHLMHGAHALDAAPRIALDPAFGLAAFGETRESARMAADFYLRDIEVITRATRHGRYQSASAQAIALAEYEYGGHSKT
jgi:rhamnose utilization protein RhaD (predicted bifunctional aldolase and dehydrogenase)